MTKPQTPEEWEAAVRDEVEALRSLAVASKPWPSTPQGMAGDTADRLAALLPPAKERVPWWEAKGRTVDGFEIVQVEDGRVGPVAWYLEAPGDPRKADVDPDGRVEVDAL